MCLLVKEGTSISVFVRPSALQTYAKEGDIVDDGYKVVADDEEDLCWTIEVCHALCVCVGLRFRTCMTCNNVVCQLLLRRRSHLTDSLRRGWSTSNMPDGQQYIVSVGAMFKENTLVCSTCAIIKRFTDHRLRADDRGRKC